MYYLNPMSCDKGCSMPFSRWNVLTMKVIDPLEVLVFIAPGNALYTLSGNCLS